MKKHVCINPVCKKEYLPTSNNQKVCNSKKCNKWLYAKRMRRFRNNYRKNFVYMVVKKNKYINLSGIIAETQLSPITTRKQINDLIRERKLDQTHNSYRVAFNTRLSLSHHFFELGEYIVKIPSYPNSKYRFISFLEKAGLTIDGHKILNFNSIKEGLNICLFAYANFWSELLSIRLYDQFILAGEKNSKDATKAIGFFFHSYDNIAMHKIIPKGHKSWNIPTFTDNITYLLLCNASKEKKEYQIIYRVSRVDIEEILKQIYNLLSSQFAKIPINHENRDFMKSSKELINDFHGLINNQEISKRIFYAVNNTIKINGEPYLSIEKSIHN